jgi:hypothetical protein
LAQLSEASFVVGEFVYPRPTALTGAIRRDILSVLAESATMTIPAATAEVAAEWSARRRRHGDSPSSVLSAASLVFQVGADVADDVDGQTSAGAAR